MPLEIASQCLEIVKKNEPEEFRFIFFQKLERYFFLDRENSGRWLGGMECQEAIDWVGEDGTDIEVGLLKTAPQGGFDSFGETAYDIQALFFAAGTLP